VQMAHRPQTTRSMARTASALLSLMLIAPVPSIAALTQAASGNLEAAPQRVRVPTAHANVHMGPNTTQEVIVLVSKGTVLPVLKRQGEWLLVQLSPELRKTGMVMRWYKNETQGWMHDSTIEVVKTP
jgi:uncharacterized protein YgiM (DUF1202 family)